MATLSIIQYVTATLDGETLSIGSQTTPNNLTVAGAKIDNTYTIATSTTLTAWAGTNPSDFDFLCIIALDSEDVAVELTTDANNGVGDEYHTIKLKQDIPFILARDDSLANNTGNFSGTFDVIDTIKIRNTSASATAAVRFVLVT